MQITDASSFADCLPSDGTPPGLPADSPTALKPLPLLPPPHHASGSTPPLPHRQQPLGVGHTPSRLGQAASSAAGLSQGPASRLWNPYDRQGHPNSGHKLPFDTRPGQGTAHEGQSSGRKRPASEHSLLEKAQGRKLNRQTTLDSAVTSHSPMCPDTAARLPATGSRQTPTLYQWASKSQLQSSGKGSVQRAIPCGSHASPHNSVAQVLDLTEAGSEAAASADQQGPSSKACLSANAHADTEHQRRHKTWTQECSLSHTPMASDSASVVDLT